MLVLGSEDNIINPRVDLPLIEIMILDVILPGIPKSKSFRNLKTVI